MAPAANPLPFTVRVNAAVPAVVELGLSALICGAAVMGKSALFEVTPLENTVTVTVPSAAMRLAETGAVSWLALT